MLTVLAQLLDIGMGSAGEVSVLEFPEMRSMRRSRCNDASKARCDAPDPFAAGTCTGWCRTGAGAEKRKWAAAVRMIALRMGRWLEELFRNGETFAVLSPFKVRLRC